MIEIGNKIIQIAHQQDLSVEKLAKKVNLTTSALYRLLKRKDQQISRILQFSIVLNHDFLQYYQPSKSPNPVEHKALQQEKKQLKEKLDTLQRETNLLTDMLQILKAQLNKS